jgi:hypothetical protein
MHMYGCLTAAALHALLLLCRCEQVLEALTAARLAAGAVCIRFPAEFRAGAFSNPDAGLSRRAVELAVAGCGWAAQLGAQELIVWSPYDGYDYNFQVSLAEWSTAACICMSWCAPLSNKTLTSVVSPCSLCVLVAPVGCVAAVAAWCRARQLTRQTWPC